MQQEQDVPVLSFSYKQLKLEFASPVELDLLLNKLEQNGISLTETINPNMKDSSNFAKFGKLYKAANTNCLDPWIAQRIVYLAIYGYNKGWPGVIHEYAMLMTDTDMAITNCISWLEANFSGIDFTRLKEYLAHRLIEEAVTQQCLQIVQDYAYLMPKNASFDLLSKYDCAEDILQFFAKKLVAKEQAGLLAKSEQAELANKLAVGELADKYKQNTQEVLDKYAEQKLGRAGKAG